MRAWQTITVALVFVVIAGSATAQSNRSGAFDHYLLAISWTPSWCATNGDDRGDARCTDGSGAGWLLHGLWPQHAVGWPEFCQSPHPDPSRAQTAAQSDIMGSAGLAWHQWRKHGRCTGLPADAYFATARATFHAFPVPPGLTPVTSVRLPTATVVEMLHAAWREVPEGGLVRRCRQGVLHEVRLCLDRELAPRRCGADVLAGACRARHVDLPALR